MPLWFQTTQVARPHFYDRNPVMSIVAFDIGGIGPHGTTNRTSFTVGVGKKAWLDSLFMFQGRSGVAGAPGVVTSRATYTPAGGGATFLVKNETVFNVVGNSKDLILPVEGFMNTGDLVQLQTTDTSTGGTMDYAVSTKTTTFDA